MIPCHQQDIYIYWVFSEEIVTKLDGKNLLLGKRDGLAPSINFTVTLKRMGSLKDFNLDTCPGSETLMGGSDILSSINDWDMWVQDVDVNSCQRNAF